MTIRETKYRVICFKETLWRYTYDSRGQVTSADKFFAEEEESASRLVSGLQTDYSYDMAGNRTAKNQGGNTTGADLRTTTYAAANALNQYGSIQHPWNAGGYSDFSGQRGSLSDAITVNGLTADYQQATNLPYYTFRKELVLNPPANQRYVPVTITANGTTTLDSGLAYVPPQTEPLIYDADGNLTKDARWVYLWDAENRLASMKPAINGTSAGAGTQVSLYFTYDGLSRRVCRRRVDEVYAAGSGGSVSLQGTYTYRRSFTWDAWNLVQTLDSGYYGGDFNNSGTAASRLSFVHGPDLGSRADGHSGWQHAGGVNGLLAVLGTTDARRQFPLMDRLGNVNGYRRAASGSPAVPDAVYEYDAFGREVRSTGPASDTMPFRFSTKYTDNESGLVYYGYRFYDPERGRWLNRDPIGEWGGINVYAMIGNNAQDWIDYLGLAPPLEFFNPKYNSDSVLEAAIQVIATENSDACVVGIHGTPTSVWDSNTRKFHDARWLAKQIKGMEGFKDCCKIILLSCNTGNTKNTKNPVAQQLANMTGKPVWAPSDYGWAAADGRHGSAPNKGGNETTPGAGVDLDYDNPSTEREFLPKKCKFLGIF